MRTKNYFKVYYNGQYRGDTYCASLKQCKQWIKGAIVHTHMGEWKRRPTGYAYFTTTGVTVDFVRFGKEVKQ